MMQQFLKWLGMKLFPNRAQPPPRPPPVGVRVRPRAATRARPAGSRPGGSRPEANGKVTDGGPGKNAPARNRFVREDTGTHDTLKILDDSLPEPQEEGEAGIDPYNSGRFDRAKHWETRFRK